MAQNDADAENDATLDERDGYAVMEIRSKRGEGTRDEDRVKLEIGAESLPALEDKKDDAVALAEETLADLRGIQPDEE